tara:strand:+ start:917 stop:1372 length:456 start_codon:yes stop_codon:yes gene_type:complete
VIKIGLLNVSKKVVGVLSLVAAGICLLIALIAWLEYSSVKSDYDEYCTGFLGALVRIGDGGQSCEDAKKYLDFLTFAWVCFGGVGCGTGILGIVLVSSNGNQQKVIFVQQQPQFIPQPQFVPQQQQVRQYQPPPPKYPPPQYPPPKNPPQF